MAAFRRALGAEAWFDSCWPLLPFPASNAKNVDTSSFLRTSSVHQAGIVPLTARDHDVPVCKHLKPAHPQNLRPLQVEILLSAWLRVTDFPV
jgi:hypothetical protein